MENAKCKVDLHKDGVDYKYSDFYIFLKRLQFVCLENPNGEYKSLHTLLMTGKKAPQTEEDFENIRRIGTPEYRTRMINELCELGLVNHQSDKYILTKKGRFILSILNVLSKYDYNINVLPLDMLYDKV